MAIIVIAAVLLSAAAAVWCLSCGGRPARPNVVLIVVDTLRADRLGCLGGNGNLTPELDALAAQGVMFSRAFSHAPWTLPSCASILTSTYPVQHQAGGWVGRFTRLNPGVATLAERFRDAGYATGAIVNVEFLTAGFGMHRGYDLVDFVPHEDNRLERAAGKTTDAALAWIDANKKRPFFLFVHYFDPHLTYDPPQPYRRAHALEPDKEGADIVFGTIRDIVGFRQGALTLDRNTIRRLEALYNGEVAFADSELGRFWRSLDAESTIIAVTSDHGEEFSDHGGFEHGHTLYDELIHVPLLIRWAKTVPAGVRVNASVRHIDLAPTLCGLAGVPPGPAFEGESLVPLWSPDGAAEDRPVFCEGNFWGPTRFCRRADGFKVIAHQQDQRVEIYDLRADPGEMRDLSAAAELRERLEKDLLLVRKAMAVHGGAPIPVELTPVEKQRLRALGYGY